MCVGFYIQTEGKDMTEKEQKIIDMLHDSEYEMLCKLDDVCKKHDITYFLEAGTLIGAARHKDFVPWDDDIDIYLKREDYEKLLKYKNEFEPYFIHVPNAREGFFWDFTTRIMNRDVLLKKNSRESKFYRHTDCQYQFIDLFVMDNTPSGFRGKLHIARLVFLYVLATSRRFMLKYDAPSNPVVRFGMFVISRLGMFVPMKTIYKRFDKLSKKYNNNDKCENYLLTNCAASFLPDCVYKKKWYETSTELPVRDRMFSVPGDYDSSLRNYYGDYMQLPPEDKRVPDHVEGFDNVVINGVKAKDL